MAPKTSLMKRVNAFQAHMCLRPGQRPVFFDRSLSAADGMKLHIVLLPSGNYLFEYRE